MQNIRNRLSNEKGLTLIESLLSLVLFSIIGTVIYFVLLSGLNTEKKIYNETLIRDEADLVMSRIIDELYTATDKKVEEVPSSPNMLVYKIDDKTSKTVGFIGNKPVVNGVAISSEGFNFVSSTISLEKEEVSNTKSIKIELQVSKDNSNAKPLTLKSQFRLMEE